MQDTSLQVEGESLHVRAPFNQIFNNFAADMGARWNHEQGIFILPVSMEPHIRPALWSFFHSDGTAEVATFTIDASLYSEARQIEVAGRTIAERISVSRRPRLSPATAKIRGEWLAGAGHAFAPVLGASDAVLQTTLPASIASHNIPGLTLVPTQGRREALLSEHGTLTARLAVITKDLEAN